MACGVYVKLAVISVVLLMLWCLVELPGRLTHVVVVEPPQSAQFIELSKLAKDASRTVVVIVEEHHEVAPYWFHFPRANKFSVVHVDAHEDTAPPPTIHGLNVSRGAGMSSNDVFVVGAVLAGHVESVMWVWPSWDVWGPRHGAGNKSAYNRGALVSRVGRFTYVSQDWKTTFCVCLCLYHSSDNSLYACELGDDAVSDYLGFLSGGKTVTEVYRWIEKLCEFSSSFVSHHVSDNRVADGDFDASVMGKSMVLDVDLDFFGVRGLWEAESALGTLPNDLVVSVLEVLELFHFQNVIQETAANDFLRRDIFLAWHRCWQGGGVVTSSSSSSSSPSSSSCGNSVTYSLASEETERFFARSLKSFNQTAFKILGNALYRIVLSHPNAAHMLNAVGFCMYTTSSTYRSPTSNFQAEKGSRHLPRGMKLCGNYPPSVKASQVHNDNSPPTRTMSASPLDVTRRLDIFKRVLLQISKRFSRPLLVTISRSIRDGYTSPSTWRQVEHGVLKALHHVYGKLDVVYDGNLLGGRDGWSRHTRVLGHP